MVFVAGSSFDPWADENLGALLIGFTISLLLCGVVMMQGYTYYQNFGKDIGFLKALTTFILILEVAHSAMITVVVYHTTVTKAGDPGNGPNSYPLTTSVLLEVLLTAMVQCFFAFRIYRLSGSLYIPIACWSLALLRLGGGLALVSESYLDVPRQPNALTLTDKFGWLITLSVTVGAVADIIIAASLCYYLKRLSEPPPCNSTSRSTSELIDRLIIYTIQTGLITSMASVALVITFHAIQQTEIWFAIYTVLAKLYSNSYLLSLNVRRRPNQITAHSGTQYRTNTHIEFSIAVEGGFNESFGNGRLDLPSEKGTNSSSLDHRFRAF
ncbi:hypothetical protein BDZ94DRAFT_1323339 [Collybia nuda]|uniref:DUF6534 domain-containing protein n=1 Tax=Collybia nuda TaxID=64659 RepID=A0A9P6CGN7_9AGAR|nr:hypothetical protein BDZ94DRAFT_1323339 [Collybia nuda]